jgi:hypothetical protein
LNTWLLSKDVPWNFLKVLLRQRQHSLQLATVDRVAERLHWKNHGKIHKLNGGLMVCNWKKTKEIGKSWA